MKILTEMPWLSTERGNIADFDLEFEKKSKDDIINYLSDILSGKKVKDHFGNIIQLKSWNEKSKFIEDLKNNFTFMSIIKTFTKYELDLLNIILNHFFT